MKRKDMALMVFLFLTASFLFGAMLFCAQQKTLNNKRIESNHHAF